MTVRFLQHWAGDEGHAILDNLDTVGVDAGIAAIVAMAPELDNLDPTSDLPHLPDLPGYHVYGEGLGAYGFGDGWLVQVHWGMGHVSLYVELV